MLVQILCLVIRRSWRNLPLRGVEIDHIGFAVMCYVFAIDGNILTFIGTPLKCIFIPAMLQLHVYLHCCVQTKLNGMNVCQINISSS